MDENKQGGDDTGPLKSQEEDDQLKGTDAQGRSHQHEPKETPSDSRRAFRHAVAEDLSQQKALKEQQEKGGNKAAAPIQQQDVDNHKECQGGKGRYVTIPPLGKKTPQDTQGKA